MNKLALAKMGQVLAADVASGDMGKATQMILGALEARPELAVDIIEDLIVEGAKPEPDDDLIAADILMLGRVLEVIRYGVDAGRAEQIALAERLRAQLGEAVANSRMEARLLLLILNQFVAAKLDVGEVLRETMLRAMEAKAAAKEAAERPVDGAAFFRDMLAEAGDDPFAIHATFNEIGEAVPAKAQANLVKGLMSNVQEPLGNAALGFLLSSEAEVRRSLLRDLAELRPGAGAAGPIGLRRMIAMRNWLPAEERARLDAVIKKLRQKGVACAAWPQPAKAEAYVSGFDGSGMQGVFVVVPEGRKMALAAMIGRLGMGVRDAWVRHGLTKKEVKTLVGATNGQIGMASVGLDYVAAATRQFLAANATSGLMPPFGLLAFAECAGLSSLNPEPISPESLIDQLVAAIDPSRLEPTGVMNAVAASVTWPYEHGLFESWFEASDEVDALLSGKRKPKAKAVEAVLAGPIEQHRNRWAELLAWTAYAAKHQLDGLDWRDLAIVAREVLAGRPMTVVPIMRHIAEQTVELHSARRGR